MEKFKPGVMGGGKYNIEQIMNMWSPKGPSDRRTKILATLGDKCDTVEQIGQLIDSGVDIFRLDFAVGDHKSWGKTVEKLREAMGDRPSRLVNIQMDIGGIEVKTSITREHKPIPLEKG